MPTKIALSLSEQIDRAKEGRTQKYIIQKMVEAGCEMNDVKFSRKKLANKPEDSFTEEELSVLSAILNSDFTLNK